MAGAVHDISTVVKNVEISRSTSLLIDDDATNVRIALENKVRALYFNPEKPETIISDIISVLQT